MSEDKSAQQAGGPDTGEPATDAPDTAAEAAAQSAAEDGNGELAEDAAERISELQDQVLRAQAEMENIRRRAARDVENAHKFALEKFTADLLPVIDSLEKAVEAGAGSGAQPGSTEGSDTEHAAGGAVIEGVELSLKLFVSTLQKVGIVQLDPLGEPFDPQLHEAMAMVPNPDAEPNSVLDVMQKGYSLNGRLVRAAKVIVVSAPESTEQT